MDLPVTDVEIKPEKIKEAKEAGPMFFCDHFDTEIVHKIAQVFLPGLASACVDNTVGGLLKSPGSVAVDLRKEMADYLTERSENFVAESVILEGGTDPEVSDHPYDIISDFVDDFAISKRNFFSRVSGWLISEMREDRIDDFVQEMEINGFWLLERREVIAQTLLKNVDFKNTFHCNRKLNSQEELNEHALECGFRTMNCTNVGCNAIFCAAHLDNHNSICPFKILPCEQKCSDSIMRREMDRHCITVCPMKLVSCPFYQLGCQSTVTQCTLDQHRVENFRDHVVHVLQFIHKEATVEDLQERAEELEMSSSPGQLSEARDVRSLTFAIKDLEAKLGPLKVNTKNDVSEEESIDSPIKKEESIDSHGGKEEFIVSPTKKDEHNESPTKEENYNQQSSKSEEIVQSLTIKEKCTKSPAKKEEFTESPTEKEKFTESPAKTEGFTQSQTKKEQCNESPTEQEKLIESPAKKEEFTQSDIEKEELDESIPTERGSSESSSEEEEFTKSPTKKE